MIIVIDFRKTLWFILLLASALFFMWNFTGWYTQREVNAIYEKRKTLHPSGKYSRPIPRGIQNHNEWYI